MLRLAKPFATHCPSSVRPASAGARYCRPSPKKSPRGDQSNYSFLFTWFFFRLFSKMAEQAG